MRIAQHTTGVFAALLVTYFLSCAAFSPLAAAQQPAAAREILDTLSAPAAESLTPGMRELRTALAAAPASEEAAIRLAKAYYRFATEEGDLRFIGYARDALDPWWRDAEPSSAVRLMRANLRQYVHAFEAALGDLNAVIMQDPKNIHALLLRANIHTVRADYAAARADCVRVIPLIDRLMGAACSLSLDGLTGRAQVSYGTLLTLLSRSRNTSAEERTWILGRLAEMAEHLNLPAAAERHYRQALALAPRDQYLLAGLADFLLDQNRPRDVISLLRMRTDSEHLLLRLVLAEKAVGAPEFESHRQRVAAAFDVARRGGYAVHEGDESRFALHVTGDPARALELALANWQLQRENRDARALLEAAVAMNDPASAQAALDWMRSNDILDYRLAQLAGELKTGRAARPAQADGARPTAVVRAPGTAHEEAAEGRGGPIGR